MYFDSPGKENTQDTIDLALKVYLVEQKEA